MPDTIFDPLTQLESLGIDWSLFQKLTPRTVLYAKQISQIYILEQYQPLVLDQNKQDEIALIVKQKGLASFKKIFFKSSLNYSNFIREL